MTNTSSRVDVVVAEGQAPAGGDLADLLVDPPQAVDVAPDRSRRIIVIAPTKQLGQEHAEALGIEPVAIVTPRSPEAARGITADEVIAEPTLDAGVLDVLMAQTLPSLTTTEGE